MDIRKKNPSATSSPAAAPQSSSKPQQRTPTSALCYRQHQIRLRPNSEKCKLGRTLASHWISLSMSPALQASTPVSAVNTQSQQDKSRAQSLSFLEALTKGAQASPLTASAASPATPSPVLAAGIVSAPLTPLVPIDDCFQNTILSILKDIAVSGAVLPSLEDKGQHPYTPSQGGLSTSPPLPQQQQRSNRSSPSSQVDAPTTSAQIPNTPPIRPIIVGSRYQPPPTDADAMHWREIKEKLFHLRTHIRNRDEFDSGLMVYFGEEWSRVVHSGTVDDDSVMSCQPDDEEPSSLRMSPPAELVDGESVTATTSCGRQPIGVSGTAPPSPICLQPSNAELKKSTSPPPPPPVLESALNKSTTLTPPLVPTVNPRLSPPPSYQAPPSGSSGKAYHLESRDEMLRRRGSLNGSCASFNSSLSSMPAAGGGPGPSTPKTKSLTNSPLMGPCTGGILPTSSSSSNSSGICPFDYIMVIDFEATCEEPTPPNFLHEIIEFPVVVIDVQTRRVCNEFHSYVHPMGNPTLSTFCKQLTGIRQEDVDVAPTLPEVIRRFEGWYKNCFSSSARTIFATDGPWDMRDFMYNHSVKRQGVVFPALFYQWIDIKSAFANFFHCPRGKIKHMLDYLGLPLEGRLHSGIDDSRNIAKIVIGLLIRGCSLCDLDRIPFVGTAPQSIDASA